MPAAVSPRRESPALESLDPALQMIVAALASMPGGERNELLAFLDFWRDLPRDDRAVFAISVKPDLSNEAVARLCGVSVRTLYRYQAFQQLKPTLAGYLETKRRRFYLPAELEA